MRKIIEIFHAFKSEEDGVALTEYLVLLALLIGGVIVTVQIAGSSLDSAWANWQSFWDLLPAPDIS